MSAKDHTAARFDKIIAKLERLVGADPEVAYAFACKIVGRERAHRVLEPALGLLTQRGSAVGRPVLRERFLDLTENGVRYDQDCVLRVQILGALRAIGSAADVDLAKLGLRTIQLQPPARIDVAQGLRAASLLWLSEIEPSRVDFYAVELLQDPHTSRFSGEPAVTAMRVLAARGQVLPIWAVARRSALPPDCLAQAFASLRKIPADLQTEALCEHLTRAVDDGENGEATALVIAEAIILNQLAGGYRLVLDLLRKTTNLNLLLYLVTTIVRSGETMLQDELRRLHMEEKDPGKRWVYEEVLGKPGREPKPSSRRGKGLDKCSKTVILGAIE